MEVKLHMHSRQVLSDKSFLNLLLGELFYIYPSDIRINVMSPFSFFFDSGFKIISQKQHIGQHVACV